MQAMPCPIAREVGELLNLSPGTGDSTSADNTGATASGGKAAATGGGGGGRGRRREDRSSPGNRWLHDVMEVAETMKADRVEIILDEKVGVVIFLFLVRLLCDYCAIIIVQFFV